MGYVTIRTNAYLVVKKKFFGRKIFFSSYRLVINKWEEILSLGMSLIYLLGIYRYQSDTYILLPERYIYIAARAIHIYCCQSETYILLPERYIYIAARAKHI